jgi:hypothetical protein
MDKQLYHLLVIGGSNSLTVEFRQGHIHVGCAGEDIPFERLVDDLYGLLCEERGLSLC